MSELSRKRPYTDDGDITVTKKRVLTGSNGTPHVNSHSDQTEDEQIFQANLEKFRKEAIYRRMKQYHRENERSLVRIAELEKRKTTCEAGLAAMSACWQQLIETIKLFVKTEDLTPNAIKATDVFDVTAHVGEDTFPEFRVALGETANVTEALVNKLIESRGTDNSLALKNTPFSQLQQTQTECAALRSQLGLLKKQLEECVQEKDKYHTDLVAVENRIERSESQTVQAVHHQKSANASPKNAETEDTERKPSSPSVPPTASLTPTPDPETTNALLPESVMLWETRITDLEKENHNLRKELVERPPAQSEQQHTSAGYYSDFQQIKRMNATALLQTEKAQEEVEKVATSREEWQKSVLATQEQMLENLKGMVAKRDADNARLREQREQATAELVERRQKDALKWTATQEQKQLSATHDERIAILQSELSRCKARLAAEERSEDLLRFFLQGRTDEVELIEQLRQAKQDADVRSEAVEKSLSELLKDQPDIMKTLIESQEKSLRLSTELDELKKIFGDSCTVPADLGKLNEQIRLQAQELEQLRLQKVRQDQAEGDMYTELEKLSSAWEALDKQVRSKVFDLQHLEDRLAKSIVDKAKSENKYYSAMRDREAAEAEKKVMKAKSDKQDRLLELMQGKVDKSEALQKALEQELIQERKLRQQTLMRISDLEKERLSLEERLHDQKVKCNYHTTGYDEHRKSLAIQERELRTKEEGWQRQKKHFEDEVQRLKQEAATRSIHNHSSKEDSEYKHMRSLLLCSTCEMNFRAVIITKCMHTFCKSCIDARILTRQRKCPACNVQFAQSDVSTLYMQ